MDRVEEIYKRINEQFPEDHTIEVSRQSRGRLNFDLTYGEIEFPAFIEVFEYLRTQNLLENEGIFYDLGSGSGKAVLAASLLGSFSICKGIELIEEIHRVSLSLKEFAKEFGVQNIEFLIGNIFENQWSDGSCIFVNSTCFSYEDMERLSDCPVKSGTIAITTSKYFKSWQQIHSFESTMSWGFCLIFIQRKP